MALQDKVGIGELFFNLFEKKNYQIAPKKTVHTKIHAHKNVVEGCSEK